MYTHGLLKNSCFLHAEVQFECVKFIEKMCTKIETFMQGTVVFHLK